MKDVRAFHAHTRPHSRSPLWIVTTALLSGICGGLLALVYNLTKRHGESLLRLEALEAERAAIPAPPALDQTQTTAAYDPRQDLFARGMPPGSVGMNFELPGLDGRNYTLTEFKGQRVLLVFISPTCRNSIAMLPALARLSATPAGEQPLVIFISTGGFEVNRQMAADFGIEHLVLMQEHNEVALLYFAAGTPMAYLLDEQGLTEMPRIEGPQAILGVALTEVTGHEAPSVDQTTPAATYGAQMAPLRLGDRVPRLDLPLLDGRRWTSADLDGRRTLLVLFDPLCAPCLDLLPALARLQADSALPEVVMITRRAPELTAELGWEHEMAYPIAVQQHWDVSRKIGVLAVPVACLVGSDGCLETALAVGQQAVQRLIQETRPVESSRRLVSLASLLR